MPRTTRVAVTGVSLRARIGGYCVDMVIFAAILMMFTVLAGLTLLLLTGGATRDPETDAPYYSAFAIVGFGAPVVWTLLNVALLATRGQTGGQYVAGIRIRREDGSALRLRDAVTWWFCFNPLLFSWPMAAAIGLPLAAVIALVLSRVTIVAFGVLITICVAAPLIALVSAMLDGQHRTLHDRVVGAVAVPAG